MKLAAVLIALLLLSGCAFTRAVGRMNTDKYQFIPARVLSNNDGSLAVLGRMEQKNEADPEKARMFAVATEKTVARSIKKASQRKGVRHLKILIEPKDRGRWYLLPVDGTVLPGGGEEGVSLGVPFSHSVSGKQYLLQVDRVNLDPKLSDVRRKGVNAAQIFLFLPAFALDIVTSPIQLFIYGNLYGKGWF